MRILSNFDTRLADKLYTEYSAAFGPDRVMIVHKSKLFYYWHVWRPLFVWLILLSVGLFFFDQLALTEIYYELAFWGLFLIYLLVVVASISRKYVDYKMDFLVVTPKEIIKYDQKGVFGRHTDKLHADKIKSISVSKQGIVKSLFDIGTLVFMAEGDSERGDIAIDHVDAVEATEHRIMHILGLDRG